MGEQESPPTSTPPITSGMKESLGQRLGWLADKAMHPARSAEEIQTWMKDRYGTKAALQAGAVGQIATWAATPLALKLIGAPLPMGTGILTAIAVAELRHRLKSQETLQREREEQQRVEAAHAAVMARFKALPQRDDYPHFSGGGRVPAGWGSVEAGGDRLSMLGAAGQQQFTEPLASMSDAGLAAAARRAPLPMRGVRSGSALESQVSGAWNSVSRLWPEMASNVSGIRHFTDDELRAGKGGNTAAIHTGTNELVVPPNRGRELEPEVLWHELVHLEQIKRGDFHKAPYRDASGLTEHGQLMESEAHQRGNMQAAGLLERFQRIQNQPSEPQHYADGGIVGNALSGSMRFLRNWVIPNSSSTKNPLYKAMGLDSFARVPGYSLGAEGTSLEKLKKRLCGAWALGGVHAIQVPFNLMGAAGFANSSPGTAVFLGGMALANAALTLNQFDVGKRVAEAMRRKRELGHTESAPQQLSAEDQAWDEYQALKTQFGEDDERVEKASDAWHAALRESFKNKPSEPHKAAGGDIAGTSRIAATAGELVIGPHGGAHEVQPRLAPQGTDDEPVDVPDGSFVVRESASKDPKNRQAIEAMAASGGASRWKQQLEQINSGAEHFNLGGSVGPSQPRRRSDAEQAALDRQRDALERAAEFRRRGVGGEAAWYARQAEMHAADAERIRQMPEATVAPPLAEPAGQSIPMATRVEDMPVAQMAPPSEEGGAGIPMATLAPPLPSQPRQESRTNAGYMDWSNRRFGRIPAAQRVVAEGLRRMFPDVYDHGQTSANAGSTAESGAGSNDALLRAIEELTKVIRDLMRHTQESKLAEDNEPGLKSDGSFVPMGPGKSGPSSRSLPRRTMGGFAENPITPGNMAAAQARERG